MNHSHEHKCKKNLKVTKRTKSIILILMQLIALTIFPTSCDNKPQDTSSENNTNQIIYNIQVSAQTLVSDYATYGEEAANDYYIGNSVRITGPVYRVYETEHNPLVIVGIDDSELVTSDTNISESDTDNNIIKGYKVNCFFAKTSDYNTELGKNFTAVIEGEVYDYQNGIVYMENCILVSATPPKRATFTVYDFRELRNGMTYEEVAERIGFDGDRQISEAYYIAGNNSTVDIYSWILTDYAIVTAEFQDGHLVSKSQIGLPETEE